MLVVFKLQNKDKNLFVLHKGVTLLGVRQNSFFEKKGYTFVNQLKIHGWLSYDSLLY